MAGNAGSLESLAVEVGELESALKDGLQARRRNHAPGHFQSVGGGRFPPARFRGPAIRLAGPMDGFGCVAYRLKT